MPGRPYLQQAVSAARQAADALKSDSRQIMQLAEAEKNQLDAQGNEAERKRNTAVIALAALDNDDQTRADMLRKEIIHAEKEANEAQAKAKEIIGEASRRAQEAMYAAADASGIAGSLERLLGRNGIE